MLTLVLVFVLDGHVTIAFENVERTAVECHALRDTVTKRATHDAVGVSAFCTSKAQVRKFIEAHQCHAAHIDNDVTLMRCDSDE